jgi:hypothetical protein
MTPAQSVRLVFLRVDTLSPRTIFLVHDPGTVYMPLFACSHVLIMYVSENPNVTTNDWFCPLHRRSFSFVKKDTKAPNPRKGQLSTR